MPRKKNVEEVTQEEQGSFQAEPEASLEEAEVFPVDAESEETPGVIPGSEEYENAAEELLAVEPEEETTDGEDDPEISASVPDEGQTQGDEMIITEPAKTEEAAEPKAAQEDERARTAEDAERRAFYDLDFRELDRHLSPEEQQEWNSIYASYRGRSAMSGSIIGVDLHKLRVRDRKSGEQTSHEMYCAVVIPFRVRILIPESEMWLPGEDRPSYVLRNMPGAVIDFVITHVDRKAGFAVASRRQAMLTRRYFFGLQPNLNSPGSRLECQVLAVGPRRCLVSCYGHDIALTQRELSYTSIADLREVYHTGQSIRCIVKAYERGDNQLTISVKEVVPNPYDGAEDRHPVQSRRQGVIAGKYGGGVFCNLPDGVTVMCNYSFHYDDAAFRAGDRVIIVIQRYDEEKKQIYGKIVAKC